MRIFERSLDTHSGCALVAGVSGNTGEQRGRPPVWLWPNVLGLDAPLVAVVWQYFFAEVFRIKIPPSNYLTLGLVVWVIYSADRLCDARRLAAPERAAARHRFYRDHFWLMGALTALVAALAGYLCVTALPGPLLHFGVVMSALVLLYFVHRLWVKGPMLLVLPKEVFTGFVFAIGATLTGFVWTSEVMLGRPPLVLVSPEVLWFGALCSLNCLAISVWEMASDTDNDPNAVAQLWPRVAGLFPALAVAVAAAAVAFALVHRGAIAFPVFAAVAAGALCIALLALVGGRMRSEVLRVSADLAVLLPALCFLPVSPWVSTA